MSSTPNQEFLDYLRQQYDAGLTLDQIRQNLRNTRWTEQDLEAAIENSGVNIEKPPVSRWKMSTPEDAMRVLKRNSIILAVLIVLDILFVAVTLPLSDSSIFLVMHLIELTLVFFVYRFYSRVAAGILFALLTIGALAIILDSSDGISGSISAVIALLAFYCFWATIKFQKLRALNVVT